jgi:DHA1 family bicyclomycin/chloramphenicol resistance-like MFS transporter
MWFGNDRVFRLGTCTPGLDARFGWGGLTGLVLSLLLYPSMFGLIAANSGALVAVPYKAGADSAMISEMHYGTGVLSVAMTGWFADSAPWTMGWIIGLGPSPLRVRNAAGGLPCVDVTSSSPAQRIHE